MMMDFALIKLKRSGSFFFFFLKEPVLSRSLLPLMLLYDLKTVSYLVEDQRKRIICFTKMIHPVQIASEWNNLVGRDPQT